jgi:hypothetical protein
VFSIVLGKSDGAWVKADAGSDFLFYLDNENVTLNPGEYIVMIDPIWNECANKHAEFKNVHLDIYSTQQVEIEPIDDYTGITCLASMLKNYAKTLAPAESKQFYLRDSKPEYADTYRILDVDSTGCWYGYFYTNNGSQYPLKEKFMPDLKGGEVVWPLGTGKDIPIEIAPGQDHIVVCRRTAA